MHTFFRVCIAALLSLAGVVQARNSVWSWKNEDLPPPRTSGGPYTPSACGNGGGFADATSQEYAYACPHHAMLSDDMILAAKYDGNYNDFVYAVAGSATDSECGTCFQVQLLDAERQWRDDFPHVIVQVINSGFDVMQGQLDLFIGGGGFGYFTALTLGSRHSEAIFTTAFH